MPLKIFKEDDLLDLAFRIKVIKEIEGQENQARKMESLKRYEIYKDQTKKYVMALMRQEMDPETIVEVEPRMANISVCKTIINKKSRVYSSGIRRESEDQTFETQLGEIAEYTDLDEHLKKIDSYKTLAKNSELYIYPVQDEKTQKYYYRCSALMPHSYDVIEDYYCPEMKKALILSYFTGQTRPLPYLGGDGRGMYTPAKNFRDGDGTNQSIADSPADQGKPEKLYIVWSDKYHFTMNAKGEMVDKSGNPVSVQVEEIANPIGKIPSVSFNEAQDGSYWALGGDDLIDGSILLNVLMTDMNFIAKVQGMGLFYYFGKGIPKTFKIGPNRAITHEVQPGDPTPEVGFASSNPPLDEHMKMIEQYIGLILTTNGLSPATISNKLDATNFTSGVHEMISKAEVSGSIEDEQLYYMCKEKEVVDIISLWHNLYIEKRLLVDELQVLGKVKDPENFSSKFDSPEVSTSESTQLDNIQKRRDLGIDSIIDSIMRDNPDIDRDKAILKATQVIEDQQKYLMAGLNFGVDGAPAPVDPNAPQAGDPNMPKQEAGMSLSSTQGVDVNVQKTALNGAQVTALAGVVQNVALGLLPRESAKGIIINAFQLDDSDAEQILGSAGKGFKVNEQNLGRSALQGGP